MKIAFIGMRGIPVSYGTFETFAEALSTELVKRGHTVTVYCRRKYVKTKGPYRGVDRVVVPGIETKHLSTVSYSFLSSIHACFLRNYDLIFYLGVGSTFCSIIPKLTGVKTVIHIDGLDWERKKWGGIAKFYLKTALFVTNFLPDSVISDNNYMVEFYRKKYKKEIENIPYGYFPQKIKRSELLLKKYGLKKGNYYVWVGRIVPENNLEELINAFTQQRNTVSCLIIGDDFGNSSYKKTIKKLVRKEKRIIMTGFIDHEDVLVLVANAFAYVETKRIGGTQMALIEAMGTGVLIVSNNNEENKNVLSDTALYYNTKEGYKGLAEVLRTISKREKKQLDIFRQNVKKRVIKNYNWEAVVSSYEKLFKKVLQK